MGGEEEKGSREAVAGTASTGVATRLIKDRQFEAGREEKLHPLHPE